MPLTGWERFYSSEEEFREAAQQLGRTLEQHLAALQGSAGIQQPSAPPAPIQPGGGAQQVASQIGAPPNEGDTRPVTTGQTDIQWVWRNDRWVIEPIGQATASAQVAAAASAASQIGRAAPAVDWEKLWKEQLAKGQDAAAEYYLNLLKTQKDQFDAFLASTQKDASVQQTQLMIQRKRDEILQLAETQPELAADALAKTTSGLRNFIMEYLTDEQRSVLEPLISAKGLLDIGGAPSVLISVDPRGTSMRVSLPPGSELYNEALRRGWKPASPQTELSNYKQITDEELLKQFEGKRKEEEDRVKAGQPPVPPKTPLELEREKIEAFDNAADLAHYKESFDKYLQTEFSTQDRAAILKYINDKSLALKKANDKKIFGDLSALWGKPGNLKGRADMIRANLRRVQESGWGPEEYLRAALETLYAETKETDLGTSLDRTSAKYEQSKFDELRGALSTMLATSRAGMQIQWPAGTSQDLKDLSAMIWDSMGDAAKGIFVGGLSDQIKAYKTGEVVGEMRDIIAAAKSAFPELKLDFIIAFADKMRADWRVVKELGIYKDVNDFVKSNTAIQKQLKSTLSQSQLSAHAELADIISKQLGTTLSATQLNELEGNPRLAALVRQFGEDEKFTSVKDFWDKGVTEAEKSFVLRGVKSSMDILAEPATFQKFLDSYITARAPGAYLDADSSGLYKKWKASGLGIEEFFSTSDIAKGVTAKVIEKSREEASEKQLPKLRQWANVLISSKGGKTTDSETRNALRDVEEEFMRSGMNLAAWLSSDASQSVRSFLEKTIEESQAEKKEATAEKDEAAKLRKAVPLIDRAISTFIKSIGLDALDWNDANIESIKRRAAQAYDIGVSVENWLQQNSWVYQELGEVAGRLQSARTKQSMQEAWAQQDRAFREEQLAKASAKPRYQATLAAMGLEGRQRLQLANFFEELYDEWKGRATGNSFEEWLRSLGTAFLLDLLEPFGGAKTAPTTQTVYRRAID